MTTVEEYQAARVEADARLVRCGCGLVRNDDDHELEIRSASDWAARVQLVSASWTLDSFEKPRLCRGCGCVYMLPKPQAPTVPT